MTRCRGQQEIKQPFFCGLPGLFCNTFFFLTGYHVNSQLQQVTDHGLNITPHISHFGKLGGLDFKKRGLGKISQPARYFSLSHSGRSDHDNIFRRNLLTQGRRHLLPAPAVTQGNSNRAFCITLTDNIAVKLPHCLSWC